MMSEELDSEKCSWKNLFSDVFSRHSETELEQHWAAGTIGNIPGIDNVNTGCPKPWAFVRVFGIALIIYLILLFCWNKFAAVNLLPGLIIVGTTAIPLSVLIFFFEMNVRRNVSMYLVCKMLILGGALSLLFSLFMFQVTARLGLGWLGASVAGIAEETGKLLAVMLVVNQLRYPYLLNGLLFGAAVGAGFSAFESAGYALGALITQIIALSAENAEAIRQALGQAAQSGDSSSVFHTMQMLFTQLATKTDTGMFDSITVRGLLSPFSHIIWSAMAAAGLWMVKGGRKFECGMLGDFRFLRLFLAAVVLHMVWNASWNFELVTAYDKHIVLGIIGWGIIFQLVRRGLRQIAEEKTCYASEPMQEPGVAAIIGEQQIYVEALTASRPATPRTNGYDHLEIADEVRESKLHEQRRERPNFSDRAWKKYYTRDPKDR